MVRINPSVTLELKSGQTITIDLDEAQQIIKGLTKFLQEGDGRTKGKTTQQTTTIKQKKRRRKNAGKGGKSLVSSMSDTKRKSIHEHINKQLSAEPKTLSRLLKGISYVPNHLPMIRQMIEDQKYISKKKIGKRTFYFSAGAERKRIGRTQAL